MHRRRSYANNKLAQVLHTHELTRRLQEQQNHHVQVVSVCPGWVSGTGIVADSFADKIIQTCGFELESATMAHIGMYVCMHLG